MRIYLEATENVAEGIEGDFVRIDVTGYTETEIADIKQEIIDIMAGKSYTLQKHICGHEDNAECKVEDA